MATDRERGPKEGPSWADFERRTYSPTHGFANPRNPPQGGTGVPPKPAAGPAPIRVENPPGKPGNGGEQSE